VAIPASVRQRAIRAVSLDPSLGVVATADGRVTAWGSADASRDGAVPAPAGLRNVVDVRAISGPAGYSAIALTGDGRVTAWGADTSGVQDIPPSIQGHVIAIDAGPDYVAAVTDTHRIEQWGNTSGISAGMAVPADIQGKVEAVSLSKSAGSDPNGRLSFPNLALLEDGKVAAWGTPMGSNAAWTVPEDIQGMVKKVVPGQAPAAILTDGSIRFWGSSSFPYVANGLPTGLSDVTDLQIEPTGHYAMALTASGDVFLWGSYGSANTDEAMKASLTGPVATGASAIALAPGAPAAAVVRTGLAIGSDPVVAGSALLGKTLTGTAATFSGAPVPTTSQWLANNAPIPGAAGPTLTLTSAYVGKRISYRTTAGSGADALVATSTSTAPVAKPAPPKPPVHDGGGSGSADKQKQLAKDKATLKHDQAKLKKLKKAFKKAHGAKKAKLKKKMAKLKKKIKADKKKIKADT
jgi:hypothetical protein